MDCFEFAVIGSGPSGVAAARRLAGKGTCIVDIGALPAYDFPYRSLEKGLAAGSLDSMLGPNWEMLTNLVVPGSAHVKLRAPATRHVSGGCPFKVHDARGDVILEGAGTHAAGGMSNAWGAQLLRYTDADLAEVGDWPIDASSLTPYYSELEAYIGIAGEADEMHDFLGETTDMLPPAPIVPAANYLLERHTAQRQRTHLRLGRSRLAVLTRPHRNHPQYSFGETEFFSTEQKGLYTARRTLDELRASGQITYLGQNEFLAYRESREFVEIDLRDCKSNAVHSIRAKHLLLGCGTLQTARLVLMNKQAMARPLPFIDHLPTLAPLFIPRMFGAALPAHSFPVQLTATMEKQSQRDMVSLYYPGGMLWSDLLSDIPLPLDAAIKLLPFMLGGMLVAQIWEASRPAPGNRLSLDPSGFIRIDYPSRPPYTRLKPLLSALRSLGAYSLSSLASTTLPGWGFHHAASLPMRHAPDAFETHVDGRLWDSMRVRIIDGSVLPSLPAKNHSLTLMANAARIAEETLRCGY